MQPDILILFKRFYFNHNSMFHIYLRHFAKFPQIVEDVLNPTKKEFSVNSEDLVRFWSMVQVENFPALHHPHIFLNVLKCYVSTIIWLL